MSETYFSELSEMLDVRLKIFNIFCKIELSHIHLVGSRIFIVWLGYLIYRFKREFAVISEISEPNGHNPHVQ